MADADNLASSYDCKDFSDIAACFEKLQLSMESKLESKLEPIVNRLKKVEKKTETIEGAVVYANDEFKTLHKKTIPDIKSKLEGLKTRD